MARNPTDRPASEYIGLAEAAARRLAEDRGIPFRIVERDGDRFFVTADLRYGRIDVAITGGVVTAASEEYDHVAETLIRLVDLDVFAAAVEHRRSAWERRGVSVEFRRGDHASDPAGRVVLATRDARGQLTVRVSGAVVMEVARDRSKDWRATRDGVTSEEISGLLDDLETRVAA